MAAPELPERGAVAGSAAQHEFLIGGVVERGRCLAGAVDGRHVVSGSALGSGGAGGRWRDPLPRCASIVRAFPGFRHALNAGASGRGQDDLAVTCEENLPKSRNRPGESPSTQAEDPNLREMGEPQTRRRRLDRRGWVRRELGGGISGPGSSRGGTAVASGDATAVPVPVPGHGRTAGPRTQTAAPPIHTPRTWRSADSSTASASDPGASVPRSCCAPDRAGGNDGERADGVDQRHARGDRAAQRRVLGQRRSGDRAAIGEPCDAVDDIDLERAELVAPIRGARRRPWHR